MISRRMFISRKHLVIALCAGAVAVGSFELSDTAMAGTVLSAATQTPAVMANLSLTINLTAGAQVPTGQTAHVLQVSTAGTHGAVSVVSSTSVTYTPGSYFANVAKGASARDAFTYCLTDAATDVSCNSVTVTIFGVGQATTPPPTTTPPATTASYTCLRNWYVSQNGSEKNAGTATTVPWLTLQHADQSGLLKAGDCVNVAPGTYPITATQSLNNGGNANTATGYVVYRSTTPNGAKIVAAAVDMENMIQIAGNYLIFDGFEVDGGNAGLVNWPPFSFGNGIFGLGHHLQVLNNLVHDCGGGGIGLVEKDWYWIVGNKVYNNSHFDTGETSGISVWEPRAVSFTPTSADTSATYHIIVKNNVVYGNVETYVPGNHTDGNGIIFDDFLNLQTGNAPYPYKSLIQANTSYSNGARGIHVFQTKYATIDSNIAYNNNLDEKIIGPWRGELSNVLSSNIIWSNNQLAATSVLNDPQRQYNTAVLDEYLSTPNVNVVWQNNANIDTRTGGKSWRILNPTLSAAFPANNPLGKPL